MAKQETTTTTTDLPKRETKLGIGGSIKHVIVTICSLVVKACNVADTTLDATQDIADTGKLYTNQLKKEVELETLHQLKELEQSLNS